MGICDLMSNVELTVCCLGSWTIFGSLPDSSFNSRIIVPGARIVELTLCCRCAISCKKLFNVEWYL